MQHDTVYSEKVSAYSSSVGKAFAYCYQASIALQAGIIWCELALFGILSAHLQADGLNSKHIFLWATVYDSNQQEFDAI